MIKGHVMKNLLFALLFAVTFSASAYQAGSGTIGSSASGPNVECQLPSGESKYIPVLVCKSYGGSH